jgi:hypothetical protein
MKFKVGELIVLRAMLYAFVLTATTAGAQSIAPDVQSQQAYPTPASSVLTPTQQPPTTNDHAVVIPGAQASPAMDLPQVWHATIEEPLPPAPPVMPDPVIPASFFGCWKGNPGGWDERTRLPSANPLGYNIGAPGEIIFCYRDNTLEIPLAKVYISPAKRVLDLALNLGLNYNTASAHSISADLYSISPTTIHSRTRLTVVIRGHILLLFPVDYLSEPIIDDETATLVAPDAVRVEGRQVLFLQGAPQYSATWHANFSRISDESN